VVAVMVTASEQLWSSSGAVWSKGRILLWRTLESDCKVEIWGGGLPSVSERIKKRHQVKLFFPIFYFLEPRERIRIFTSVTF
jgi:hypothetical protein